MNLKGQVAATMTWFIATVVIFSIMAFFFMGVGALAGWKKITGSETDISVLKEGRNLLNEEILYSFINSQTTFEGNSMSEKNLIYLWAKEKDDAQNANGRKTQLSKKIKSDFTNLIGDYNQPCYTLYLEYSGETENSFLVAGNQFEENELIFQEGDLAEEFFQEALSFNLYFDKEVKGRFYMGTC